MSGIFLNYRREDTSGYARGVVDRLRERFGTDHVFMDVDRIEPGVDFVDAIEAGLDNCDALLVLIGKQWLTASSNDGQRRLDDPGDYVRMEIATALRRKVRVIPVLVRGATMPAPEDLPEDIASITRRQALELSDVRWDYDLGRLAETLEKVTGHRTRPATGTIGRTSPPLDEPAREERDVDTGVDTGVAAGREKHRRGIAALMVGLAVLGLVGIVITQTKTDPGYTQPEPDHAGAGQTVPSPPVERSTVQPVLAERPAQQAADRAPAELEPAPRNPAPAVAYPELIMEVQLALAELGYQPGPVDGQSGQRTTEAVKAFQRNEGLPVTGRIDEDLLDELDDAAEVADAATISGLPNLSGTWYDDSGIAYQLVHEDDVVTGTSYNPLTGEVIGKLQGTLTGNTITYSYQIADGSTGAGRATVMANGQQMQSVSKSAISGVIENANLYREHPGAMDAIHNIRG